ncbi:sugar transferase [Gemmatimonadota bacterium]
MKNSQANGIYRDRIKRLFDLVAALIILVVLLPVMAVLSIPVALSLGLPVFYRQERAGRFGKPFQVIKFRTMTNERDSDGNLLPDEQRLTRIGNFMRSTSLDELPELLNVIQGDMSFIGPRPLLVHYLPRYSPEQMRRHELRSGITGWAQVNGRNAISWEDRFRLDVWYVDHCSLPLDLVILIRTAWSVLTHKGISAPGSATMPEFLGTKFSSANGEDNGE